MEFYINNRRETESFFWNSLQGIASESQRCRLLDGNEVIIGGVSYQIVFISGQ